MRVCRCPTKFWRVRLSNVPNDDGARIVVLSDEC
jgi:hypothetical protein